MLRSENYFADLSLYSNSIRLVRRWVFVFLIGSMVKSFKIMYVRADSV